MNPTDKIHSSWGKIKEILVKSEFPGLKELNTVILPSCNFLPPKEDIFNVLTMPLQNIKVVLLGQDPYPKIGDAIGRAFAINKNRKLPASLRNIQRELSLEGYSFDKEDWQTLEHWTQQGVFLLNTALTVEEGKAGSHLKYWRPFMNALISHISYENPCIWVLWGKHAESFEGAITKNRPNVILKAAHPAAESYKSNSGFFGCNHFIKINEILKEQNKQLINF